VLSNKKATSSKSKTNDQVLTERWGDGREELQCFDDVPVVYPETSKGEDRKKRGRKKGLKTPATFAGTGRKTLKRSISEGEGEMPLKKRKFLRLKK